MIGRLLAASPTLTALKPSVGHPHDVVFIDGTGREGAQIVWDAGTPGKEKVIPGAYLGAFMFSVPPDAAPGPHVVKLQNSDGRSNSMTFTVPEETGPLDVPHPPGGENEFPPPRIDAVTVISATFVSSGVNVLLYVQGANIDVGATVSLKASPSASPVPVATVSHRALRNDWFGVSSTEFEYPIYHYSSTVVSLGVRPAGQKLWFVVKNLDNKQSKEFEYKLPSDANTIDSDGDGLRDKWETLGYDANDDGAMDVVLPGLGANPYRRDLFLELDIMDNLQFPPHSGDGGAPDSTVVDGLKRMFEAAPILNYGGAPGIRLVVDATGKPCLPNPPNPDVCSFAKTEFTNIGTLTPAADAAAVAAAIASGQVSYSLLKAHNFRNDLRGSIYHYAIWGVRRPPDYDSGISDVADDFLISIDQRPDFIQSRRSQIERLAHEFGHNLGQLHGGSDNIAYKPNYLSVMSYNWDLRTGWENERREQRATCLPFYYAEKDATEMGGVPPTSVNTIVDYSEGMGKPLVKPPASTAPSVTKMCGSTVDWSVELSKVPPATIVKDFANWPALVFTGPTTEGRVKP